MLEGMLVITPPYIIQISIILITLLVVEKSHIDPCCE